MKGNEATSKDASGVLKPMVDGFDLPYECGYKLDYYAQEVLVVLVALGRSVLRKEGRRFLFTVS
jgi:hypothetical protein